jgi:DNA-binding transcriptional ArsR family regulator
VVECSGEALDRVYSALSNSSRRELIEQLAKSPARVTDLSERFDMSLAGVSKHIRVLQEAGVVHRNVHGREHVLSLEPAPLAGAAGWLDGYRRFWEDRLDLLDRGLRESTRKRR